MPTARAHRRPRPAACAATPPLSPPLSPPTAPFLFGRWTHIDHGDFAHLHSRNITSLPFADGAAALVYASHVFEYFDRQEAPLVLREWRRVLRPGGVLRLAVPDFEAVARLYLRPDSGVRMDT